MPVETVSNYNEDALAKLVARIESDGGTIRQVIPHGDRWTVLYDAPIVQKIETRKAKDLGFDEQPARRSRGSNVRTT